MFDNAWQVWVMKHSIPTESVFENIGNSKMLVHYLVCIRPPHTEAGGKLAGVALLHGAGFRASKAGKIYVLAKIERRQAQEMAVRRSCPRRDQSSLRAWGGQVGGGPDLRLCRVALADCERRSNPVVVLVPRAQEQIAGGRVAQWVLFTALEFDAGGFGAVLGTLYAVDTS